MSPVAACNKRDRSVSSDRFAKVQPLSGGVLPAWGEVQRRDGRLVVISLSIELPLDCPVSILVSETLLLGHIVGWESAESASDTSQPLHGIQIDQALDMSTPGGSAYNYWRSDEK